MAPTTEQTNQFLASIGLSPAQSNTVLASGGKLAESVVSQLYPEQVDLPGVKAYTESVGGNWYVNSLYAWMKERKGKERKKQSNRILKLSIFPPRLGHTSPGKNLRLSFIHHPRVRWLLL